MVLLDLRVFLAFLCFLDFLPPIKGQNPDGKTIEYKDIVCCEFIRINNLKVKIKVTVGNMDEAPVEIKNKIIIDLCKNKDYILQNVYENIMNMRLQIINNNYPSFKW